MGNIAPKSPSTPVKIPGLQNIQAVACGEFFSLALDNGGYVWAWGSNSHNELGRGGAAPYYNTPQEVKGLNGLGTLGDIKAITVGNEHSLALKKDGTIWAWGDNGNGELGVGTYELGTTPVATENLTDVVSIAAGNWHSLAVKNDGTVWGWGDNAFSQLGIEEQNNLLPVQVTGIPLLARPLVSLNVQAADSSGPAQLLTCFKTDVTGYEMIVENPLERVKFSPTTVPGANVTFKLNGAVQSDGMVDLAVIQARTRSK